MLERNPVELYNAFETAGFDVYETSFDSFTEYIAHERSIPLRVWGVGVRMGLGGCIR